MIDLLLTFLVLAGVTAISWSVWAIWIWYLDFRAARKSAKHIKEMARRVHSKPCPMKNCRRGNA